VRDDRRAGLTFVSRLCVRADLHVGDNFETVIEYLRSLLDRVGPQLDDKEKEECREAFRKACEYEVAFFDMAWRVHSSKQK